MGVKSWWIDIVCVQPISYEPLEGRVSGAGWILVMSHHCRWKQYPEACKQIFQEIVWLLVALCALLV